MTDKDITLQVEQGECKVRLASWLVTSLQTRKDLTCVNTTAKLLGKIWLKHRKCLVPSFSPLQNVADVAEFSNLNHSTLAKAGFHKIKDLLVKGNLPPFEFFQHRITNFNRLYYYQIRSLITALQKWNHWKTQFSKFEVYWIQVQFTQKHYLNV